MTDKLTLVTGASRGIGAAVARLCAAAGHKVIVNYRADDAAAANVVSAIEAAGGTAVAISADTSNEAEVLAMFETIDRDHGLLTGLVNNAGVHGPRGHLVELSKDQIDHVLGVNVVGCFLCAREAIKRMSTSQDGNGGAIVNVSSGSAVSGSPKDGILYAASKGAVNSLTIGLSQEVAIEGIRVNTVSPGLTETDMPTPDAFEILAPKIPMGRAGKPEEIAEAIVWLLSDAASYVSGANLRVGGGKP